MNVLEKAEKALEYLRIVEGSTKNHELQNAAGTLGRCLGVLGSRANCSKHYANLLHTALPTLLSLASSNSAEVRLVGDEALNRTVVGGFSFHAYKTNIILQNQIEHTRNARWIRAALNRICLGETWLRPGIGKIRNQAQALFPKLSLIVRQTSEIQLIVEALENNLPRILNALAEYTTDEEISELSLALLSHVGTSEAGIRRGIATCVAHLCKHRDTLLTDVIAMLYDKLWPSNEDQGLVVGWFCVIKAIFQINSVQTFSENDLFNVQDYLELYHLCIHYIERHTNAHNILNAVMECLSVILAQATSAYKKALLERHPKNICLDDRAHKSHRRNISSLSGISMRFVADSKSESRVDSESGSMLTLNTASVEDLTIQTPDSPVSDTDHADVNIQDPDQLTMDLSEKLREIENEQKYNDHEQMQCDKVLNRFKINIGASCDDDIPLKYCARLLASKFLLTGNKGCIIPDRLVRVSLKASALNCMSEICQMYPQAVTVYLDKEVEMKSHNISGSSEGTDSNQDNINDFILERNVCYQDSLSESLSQDLLNRSIDIDSQQLLKKGKNPLEKSDSDLKSSKDAQSYVFDNKKSDLIASVITDSTNPNMTNSNFTTNSNMTGSNDNTGYPMSTSADLLSSSIDLDMKFDHFGESNANVESLDIKKDLKKDVRKKLERTDEVASRDAIDGVEIKTDNEKNENLHNNNDKNENLQNDNDKNENLQNDNDKNENFEHQHMSDVFVLLEGHGDPQIRGLVRLCIGNYLNAALDLSQGNYFRWRSFSSMAKEISDNLTTEKLFEIILKGLSDNIHSCVVHTLTCVNVCSCHVVSSELWLDIVTSLCRVETDNKYWLCRLHLCRTVSIVHRQRLFLLSPGFVDNSRKLMSVLIRLLADQDQKVRKAAAVAIADIIPKLPPSRRETTMSMVTRLAVDETSQFTFDDVSLSMDFVRELYFYSDLPERMTHGEGMKNTGSLQMVVGDLIAKLMGSSCKNYSQGILEALKAVTHRWLPWKHKEAYLGQGLLSYCLDSLDYCNGTVAVRTIMLDLCASLYPVEVDSIMLRRKTNFDIFERDPANIKEKWQHLENSSVANLAEKFMQITLKMLNVLVHLIEDFNPNVHLNRSAIALPGSPVRRKTQDSMPRKNSNASDNSDDKATLRKRSSTPANSLKANFTGHFFNEPFYMKFYESLRATYSNHKINLNPKTSIFYDFLSVVLNCLAVQLELATENEFGNVTEEILYYLKAIMPLKPDSTVFCITQLLKSLFGTNMINQYSDFLSIATSREKSVPKSFFKDVLVAFKKEKTEDDCRRDSVTSESSKASSMDVNSRMVKEKKLLMAMENFAKNRTDRKWSSNKKELERYIRLFEPVVIQALKSYTMHNDIPLQCKVLSLLNQLLTLRVNYCMLDSDQIFIGFLMKQLDCIEQREIPNCCDLVNSIMAFLVQLSSSKHHTKQIIELPKLIQLCDGLMAAGAHDECVAGLEPVAVKVFSNMSGSCALGRAQQQDAQATREVLFNMLQKTMHQPKVMDLVSTVLCLLQDNPENYYLWCELASDTICKLMCAGCLECDTRSGVTSLERLLDSVYTSVLLTHTHVHILTVIFQPTPHQATTPLKLKLRYLSTIMVLLKKVVIRIPESEIFLSINYLKSTDISPLSIFFNVKTDIDPLNVQNVNENCANLSPDVILVRFLFRILTYAIMEIDSCNESSMCADIDEESNDVTVESHRLMYRVCVNLIVIVKEMLHLTDGCQFPQTSKTAQTLLHNEQSGLNTGLYSPEENIPLDLINLICLRRAYTMPLLTSHWSHLLIRLNFLSHKYWQKLIGFSRNLPLCCENTDSQMLRVNVLQISCFMAYCEYFVENGLTEVVHLTWLVVSRIAMVVGWYEEAVVRRLVGGVQASAAAAGLLVQAVAARCRYCLQDEFALNTYKILSQCHVSQSGALVFLICRIMSKLEPSIAVRFSNLAIKRCRLIKDMTIDEINLQLSKEDIQVALEMLQKDKLHLRYSTLVKELNALASSVFDLSPLDLSQERAITPQYIITTHVDQQWLLNQAKRCSKVDYSMLKMSKQSEPSMSVQFLTCPELDRRLVSSCFKVTCEEYCKEFLNVISNYESKMVERDHLRQLNEARRKEMTLTAAVDSNKMTSAIHVFKKSDNKESKSQFFIPMNPVKDHKDTFGNLEISDEEAELIPPELSEMYKVSLTVLDKSLTDVIRLFPKQSRPLSQSENFNLNVEYTLDRYTRRCHQVFQDKLFYQEYLTIQTMLTGFLESLSKILSLFDLTDCDVVDKCKETLLPVNLCKNIAVFSVISLQYLSFLIKNKKIVESSVSADVSFRVTAATVTDAVVVDHVILLTAENVSRALTFKEIWCELDSDSNANRTQSAISCVYAIVKYLVKETKPLTLKKYILPPDGGPETDITIVGNKIVTLVEYWEENFYIKNHREYLANSYRESLEKLLVSLCRLQLVSNIALIPPIAWSSVDVTGKTDQSLKVDLPLQALQDMDVLEAFLFRVNFIGWSCKKQWEEMWVGTLGALTGNGAHWCVRGMTQLLLSTAHAHVPRQDDYNERLFRLRTMLFGTSLYKHLQSVNLERIPLFNDSFDGYYYAQFNTEYLKLAADLTDDAPYNVRKEVKRMKKNTKIDVNSSLQLLMDVTSQMLDDKAGTGAATTVALLNCLAYTSCVYSGAAYWRASLALLAAPCPSPSPAPHPAPAPAAPDTRARLHALHTLHATQHDHQETSIIYQKLLKSLSSNYPPIRQAALHGCLLQLTDKQTRQHGYRLHSTNAFTDLVTHLNTSVRQYLVGNTKISPYEQTLYWTVLFTLIELGYPDLINTAVEFLLTSPHHYCVDLVVKGIITSILQQVLPKDLKNSMIEKLLDNMDRYSEEHSVLILMVHLFSADDKLLSPKLTSDVSNMDPDILMTSMERITLLYKVLRQTKLRESKTIIASTLKNFLRETLPPAATLSRVVIEFLECCKETEKKDLEVLGERERWVECSVLNAEIVFEVFETAVSQNQLPVLSGWIFEALTHLLDGKLSQTLLPYCLLTLLTSASSNGYIRKAAPLTYELLKQGFLGSGKEKSFGLLTGSIATGSYGCNLMSFKDRRLLCVVAKHSNFTKAQLDRLRELCVSNDCLKDVLLCLDAEY